MSARDERSGWTCDEDMDDERDRSGDSRIVLADPTAATARGCPEADGDQRSAARDRCARSTR